eukprot:2422608-Prymnesium_polylepis.3
MAMCASRSRHKKACCCACTKAQVCVLDRAMGMLSRRPHSQEDPTLHPLAHTYLSNQIADLAATLIGGVRTDDGATLALARIALQARRLLECGDGGLLQRLQVGALVGHIPTSQGAMRASMAHRHAMRSSALPRRESGLAAQAAAYAAAAMSGSVKCKCCKF